ncbi:MAG: NADH-ubiquinone oxidoreductase-F iron-sulfur binding region domain-containing protein [Thermodesulfobacteriota bacterium]|nr:NADH-ubiquinone oxidoreductase-F iron-sulfur binding region domain-containing protein [Thermodesulfobacteriota bacterium]
MRTLNSTRDFFKLREEVLTERASDRPCITICSGSGCLACRSKEVTQAFAEELEKKGLSEKVDIRSTGCHGFCERGPVTLISPKGLCYLQIKVDDVPEVVEKTIMEDKIVERLLYKDLETGEPVSFMDDIPFYKYQTRVLLANNAKIDPTRIGDYLAVGGYSALAKVLSEITPEEVIRLIKKANLRGRGGGGFPAGLKWESTRNAQGENKYVLVNADEGDPGAYMDRSLLEGNPHSVLEGLIIGAYAIGANQGYVYAREEYPLAVENVSTAIRQAKEYGLLGKDIMGSGFDFEVSVYRGAGAFVSGESSALMTAVEGRVGEPRPKYVHTSFKGVWDRPSCLNNVETWANVPFIINNGVEWFHGMGTETSKGTKIFSLVGHVNNTGLVEVPMGITLRDMVFKIGGGIPKGKKFKAVQTGGPSGGVLPEEMLDLRVDFDELTRMGSMMGSGGMIVMNEETCMVETARYYVDFLAHESCGKCVPCREGLRQMLIILDNITAGRGNDVDIEKLEDLAEVLQYASLCALGQTAPNPVLSTIKYFRDEYEAHIKEKRCPACICKNLITYEIDPEKCKACGLCEKNCPAHAVSKDEEGIFVIHQEDCIKCGNCFSLCPDKFSAVVKSSPGIAYNAS